MMFLVSRSCAGLMAFVFSVAAHAQGSTVTGVPHHPIFMPTGVVLVYVEGSRPNLPACGSVENRRFAINVKTDAGKAQLAGLLSAYNMKQQVVFVGTGDCSDWGDTESLSYFQIQD